MSSRWERIAITSCLFTISYLLHSNWSGWAISRKSSATLTAADNNNNNNNVSLSNNNDDSSLIHIFYNLYVNNSADAHRVLGIFHEQTSMLNSQLHDINITVNSIGYKLNYFPNALLHNHKHYQEGGEDVTLRSLWEYCRAANPSHDSKVVYLHSKGSFHPNESNDNLRRFLTEGALSQECAHLPTECNVCSSRMSPHPHPHTSGNMWLARCNYITKLRDPYAIRKGELPNVISKDNGCKGYGRYFFEHWVYSHPSVKPCDLYTGKEYTWAYENIPEGNFIDKAYLRMAPRFDFGVFTKLLREKYWYCRDDTSSVITPQTYLENRIWYYKQLYGENVSLGKTWYLRNFLNVSTDVTI